MNDIQVLYLISNLDDKDDKDLEDFEDAPLNSILAAGILFLGFCYYIKG